MLAYLFLTPFAVDFANELFSESANIAARICMVVLGIIMLVKLFVDLENGVYKK